MSASILIRELVYFFQIPSQAVIIKSEAKQELIWYVKADIIHVQWVYEGIRLMQQSGDTE